MSRPAGGRRFFTLAFGCLVSPTRSRLHSPRDLTNRALILQGEAVRRVAYAASDLSIANSSLVSVSQIALSRCVLRISALLRARLGMATRTSSL